MTEKGSELLKRLVVGHKRDGRSCYDPDAKRELVELAMRPGVSVARMALQHGINANLLRTWIRLYQQAREAGGAGTSAVPPAFIPVVPAPPTVRGEPARLVAWLPNGVRLELESAGQEDLAAILRQLSALPCSGSTLD